MIDNEDLLILVEDVLAGKTTTTPDSYVLPDKHSIARSARNILNVQGIQTLEPMFYTENKDSKYAQNYITIPFSTDYRCDDPSLLLDKPLEHPYPKSVVFTGIIIDFNKYGYGDVHVEFDMRSLKGSMFVDSKLKSIASIWKMQYDRFNELFIKSIRKAADILKKFTKPTQEKQTIKPVYVYSDMIHRSFDGKPGGTSSGYLDREQKKRMDDIEQAMFDKWKT